MKNLILSAFVLSVFAVGAASIQKPVANNATEFQESKSAVKVDELPEAVKTTLKADLYKEWLPTSAFLVKATETEHYAIEMKRGNDYTTLKLSKDGNAVE